MPAPDGRHEMRFVMLRVDRWTPRERISRSRHIVASASAHARSAGSTKSGPRRSRTNTTEPAPAAVASSGRNPSRTSPSARDHLVVRWPGQLLDGHHDRRLTVVAVDEQQPKLVVAGRAPDEGRDATGDVVIRPQRRGGRGREFGHAAEPSGLDGRREPIRHNQVFQLSRTSQNPQGPRRGHCLCDDSTNPARSARRRSRARWPATSVLAGPLLPHPHRDPDRRAGEAELLAQPALQEPPVARPPGSRW